MNTNIFVGFFKFSRLNTTKPPLPKNKFGIKPLRTFGLSRIEINFVLFNIEVTSVAKTPKKACVTKAS